MGAAACSNQSSVKVQATLKTQVKDEANAREDFVGDHDINGFQKHQAPRTHEKLWKAVESNDLFEAEKYLDFNDVTESQLYDSFGQTMVHKSASIGAVEILMLLIERTGVKPDIVNSSLATPLHLACRNGRDQIVKFLIGCGVEVNLQDEHGQTPLLICCIHGYKEIMSMLVEASIVGHLPEPLEVDLANHQGLTPLNCAAIKGDLEMVKCLISRGQAKIDQASPKGCTPLIYAGRGGFDSVVEYLIEKKADALKQDNAGGTVLHHAIEKNHIGVLETMLANGVNIYEAIEIADNAGRTPLFEAVENLNCEDNTAAIQIIDILCKDRQEGGFGANPNVVNYNGQTPLFAAARLGSLLAVKALYIAGANVDLNNGELVKCDDDVKDVIENEENQSEKNFMLAFKNCCTPLQVALVLGYDEIALLLATKCGADVNYRTKMKGYTSLHLCVLADRPEMIMDLLTKANADPLIDDFDGRALLDMVYTYLPAYVDIFQSILEKMDGIKKMDPSFMDQQEIQPALEDNRAITGKKTQEEINKMYSNQMEVIQEDEQLQESIDLKNIPETQLMQGQPVEPKIEKVFGDKISLCLISQNWQNKEQAIRYITKNTNKYFQKSKCDSQQIDSATLTEVIEAGLLSVSLTCRDKVIKVFNASLTLFNNIIQCQRVEQDANALKTMIQVLQKEDMISKFLMQSEQSNTRQASKIHEAMLDLSYHPQIGEDIVVNSVYLQIKRHTFLNQNPKGLMSQLAMLYKLVNSFNVQESSHELDDPRPLTKNLILEVILPVCTHSKEDIRSAALKIILDIQRKTGAIGLTDIQTLPDKIRDSIWEKIQQTQVVPKGLVGSKLGSQMEMLMACRPTSDQDKEKVEKLTQQKLEDYKQVLENKGQHKDWTQRELALNAISECLNLETGDLLHSEEQFIEQCCIILKASLDDNNLQNYLIAIDGLGLLIYKVGSSEALLDSLPNLLKTVVQRTTDTNTRVRKRSVEVINQCWELLLNKKAEQSSSQLLAAVLTDSSLQEKAIIGRLGLFIKKALLIEKEELSKRSINLILGKDYEQLSQFACQWSLHKNTKVRQCALKLSVEVCRLNAIDPRGEPFKQRIINYILGLRSSIRDPLVKKINEVCKEAGLTESYIDETELELQQATKARAASYDVRNVRRQRPPSSRGSQNNALPSIGRVSALPSVENNNRPTIVLPHSEPLSESQKEAGAQVIELLSLELITCFYSQTWSSRLAALEKLEEQLQNLDPNRRDAMSAEINRSNIPPEMSFSLIVGFFQEGLRDPVLKNYISLLELIQKTLPIYIRHLRAEQIKKEIVPLVSAVISKMTDLKQKVREASMNFCLYLSHQIEIGAELLVSLVCQELETVSWDKSTQDKKDMQNQFGNSNLIVSCLNLLNQFQVQTNLVEKESEFYKPYCKYINKALKHSNPQVRKEAENLFKTMFTIIGDEFQKELKDQKHSVSSKLVADAKAESDKPIEEKGNNEIQTTTTELKDDYLLQPIIQALLKGNEDKLQQLKLPNPKKRLIAIIEIKKLLQQKLTQIKPSEAKDLVEPLSILLRFLIKDEAVEVYLEALSLLKYIVGNLAQHLSSFDLHLMMGQFIQTIIAHQNQNMKARIASDKVIVYFAKHTNIGALLVAKEILKNIDRLNKYALTKNEDNWEEKKEQLQRFYAAFQMILQQFSIVLCYQPDFYQKCIELLAESMQRFTEEPVLKSTLTQLVVGLHQIDAKLLDEAVQKLDFTKKTHLKKICIELEQTSQKGLVNQNQNLTAGVQRASSPDASFRDTQQSFTSSRQSITSPGLTMNRRLTRDRNSEVRTSRQNTDTKTSIKAQETNDNQWLRQVNKEQNQAQTGIGWLERRQQEQQKESSLPSIETSNTARRRQLGQGYVGGTKAAGFNRNDFNMTNDFSSSNTKPLETNLTSNAGLGELSSRKKDEDKTPFYVPTQREKKIAAKPPIDPGYQPSLLQRGDSMPRSKVAQVDQTMTNSSGFGLSDNQKMFGSTNSTVGKHLPGAASIEVRQPLEEQKNTNFIMRKGSFY